jgi:hypothetical protein
MAFLEIAAAALGRGIASEWMRRRSLSKLPTKSAGNSEPPDQRSLVPRFQSRPLKEIGYDRR